MLHQFQDILPILETVGFVIMTLMMIFVRSKSGVAQVSNDIISTYKQRVEQLESNEKLATQRMHEHTKEIGQLQGALTEKDKEVARLRTILENRDPELLNAIKDIRTFMEQISKHLEKQTA